MESYKFEGGELSLIRENILLIEYNTNHLLTTRNLFNLKKLEEKIMGNRPFFSVTDTRNGIVNLSDEAKVFLKEQDSKSKQKIGNAILVDSFAKKLEVEFSIRLSKPTVKTKSFTNLNKALCWFESINHN